MWFVLEEGGKLASLVAQMVKRLLAMRETWVRFLGREDPLEKEMAIHSSTLTGKIPWTEEPDRLQSMGSQRVGRDWVTSLSLSKGVACVLWFRILNFHFSFCVENWWCRGGANREIRSMVIEQLRWDYHTWKRVKAAQKKLIKQMSWRYFLKVDNRT